jgi:glycosyltransferase involved in cell wall biosynthesis
VRVLHVNDYRRAGGCEVLMDRTVSLLRDRGFEVEVFTSEDVPGHQRNAFGYIDSPRCRRALDAAVRRFEPDVVHLHNFYHELSPGVLAALRGRRVVMTAHDYHLACPNAGLYRFRGGGLDRLEPDTPPRGKLIRRWDHRGRAYSMLKGLQHTWNYDLRRRQREIDIVICPSRFMESVLASRGLNTRFIPHPLQPPAAPTGREETRPDRLHLVFAGRIELEKGLVPFLECLPYEIDGRLTIVGAGSSLDACREVCRRRDLDDLVEFTGPLPHDRTLRHIRRSHVLVLPSLWYENAPLSLLEALACGTNILTSDLGGMRETVTTAGVGFTMTAGDRASVEAALERIAAAHADGTLNDFDVSDLLASRSEQAYTDALIELYRCAS